VITLDTSGIVALVDARDAGHLRARETFLSDRGPFLLPAAILAEVASMLTTHAGAQFLDRFLQDLELGSYLLDCGEDDLSRIRALMQRYADLRLGFTDASVIACAERNGGRVLTLDLRDFGVVAREGTIHILPE
jgi:predicted nucleic acid-binding protein